MTDTSSTLADLIRQVEKHVDYSADGVPEELFLFLSRITPLVNVDLLIQDHRGYTLLTWRNDRFYGTGWHVPGGIIRFREKAVDRIRIVAERELAAVVECDATPMLVHESVAARRQERGHFISLLYRCRLTSDLDQRRRFDPRHPLPDQWQWHEGCPPNLIREQVAYAVFMG